MAGNAASPVDKVLLQHAFEHVAGAFAAHHRADDLVQFNRGIAAAPAPLVITEAATRPVPFGGGHLTGREYEPAAADSFL